MSVLIRRGNLMEREDTIGLTAAITKVNFPTE